MTSTTFPVRTPFTRSMESGNRNLLIPGTLTPVLPVGLIRAMENANCGSEMESGSTARPHYGATSASGSLLLIGAGSLDAVDVEVGYSELQSCLSKWDDVLRDCEAIVEAFTTKGSYAAS
ncbi:hypothetical protein J3D46_000242 [Paenarthrobacter sp. A20]|nr:hypothetical protein [Paenarthrobacter sp. A20]